MSVICQNIVLVSGKHPWTVSNDNCRKGKPYNTMLKLTGCVEGDFTCNDGQCIKMKARCNQVTQNNTTRPFLAPTLHFEHI